LHIPRQYTSLCWSQAKDLTLHVYADSSESAYGAAIYLLVSQDTSNESTLVFSKAKVAPLKKMTLPRLLAARLLMFVKKSLRVSDVNYCCWSDSKVALGWIKGDANRFKPFVANRVQEIQNATDPKNWMYIPGKENPADILTRGFEAERLISSEIWWLGPVNLPNKEADWNQIPEEQTDESENKVAMATICQPDAPLFQTKRWSSFEKAVNIVRLVLTFIKKLKKRKSDQQCYGHNLLNSELDEAEEKLVLREQMQSFPSEIVVNEREEHSKDFQALQLEPLTL
jgi:hypothetical protein